MRIGGLDLHRTEHAGVGPDCDGSVLFGIGR